MPTTSPVAELVIALAMAQFFFFSYCVATARGRYGVKAPATTGHETFERYFRVQMNTLELLVMFAPLLWLMRAHLGPLWIALLGALYLIGRFVYFFSYIADPAKRTLGFALSALPIVAMMVLLIVFALRAFSLGVF